MDGSRKSAKNSFPARLQRANEVPGEGVSPAVLLGHELLRAVLPHERDAALGQHPHLLDGHVLDRREDLDVVRRAARRRDPLVHPLEVLAHARRSQLSHATPACRPVTPLSRRCEKKRSARQLVHRSTSSIRLTPAASSLDRAIARSESIRPSAAPSYPANARSTSSPT